MSYPIEDLKRDYTAFAEKHSLPSFNELVRFFDLDTISEEPLHLIRAVRRCMTFKSHDYYTFSESLLSPMNASALNSRASKMSSEDRATLQECYLSLAEIELRSLELEIVYDETAECAAVTHFFTSWSEKIVNLIRIIEFLRTKGPSNARQSSYLG